jgi:hypothetical protein
MMSTTGIKTIRKLVQLLLRLEVFTAVTMKNEVFWDIITLSYLTENTFAPLKNPVG